MRIGLNFHCCDHYPSGVEYYALGLLRGMVSIDEENEYFVCTNRPDLVSEDVRRATNVTIIPVRHAQMRISRILWEHLELPRLAVRCRLDVLHCTSYICPVRRSPMPCVVTIHDTLAFDRPAWCRLTNVAYYNVLLRRSAAAATRIISVSQQAARDLGRNTVGLAPKIRVVYPGVDEIFRSERNPLRQREVRTRYWLPERYVLYVGNIEPKKNISALLEMQQRLRQAGLPHKLVVAGKRSWKVAAELKLIQCGVASGGVVWVGYADRGDLPYLYQMADVFVFPSLYEGFGFPPLEAMACGTPVVASSRGALAETVTDAAMIIDPQNVPQITAAVITMINDPCARDKYVEMGLRRSRRFTWRKAAEATLSIYQEAIEGDGE